MTPEGKTTVGFNADDFFTAYEQELAALDIATNAQLALSSILTVQAENGETRSYEQIRQEAEVFFDNPAIAADMQLLDQLAAQYAQFCAGHGHEGIDQLTSGSLEELFERGLSNAHHHEHAHEADDEKTKKKKKSSKARRLGLWALAARYGQNS
jgi:thiamine pyrophosphate-dependent acetolactate synthase large subunit-like protein